MHPAPLLSGPLAAAFPASIQSGVHRQAVDVRNVLDDGSEIVIGARLRSQAEQDCKHCHRHRVSGGIVSLALDQDSVRLLNVTKVLKYLEQRSR